MSKKSLPVNIVAPDMKGKPPRPEWAEVLPEPPFTMLIVAPRKSGKTVVISNLVSRLLANHHDAGKCGYFAYKVLISPTAEIDTSARDLVREMDEVYKGWDDQIINHLVALSNEFKRQLPILLILDDILGLLPRVSNLSWFVTRNRHYNISLIVSTQHFRGVSNLIRENACGIIVFKISNTREYKALCEEMAYFEDAYQVAVLDAEPYSFLYVKIEGGELRFYKKFEKLLFIA